MDRFKNIVNILVLSGSGFSGSHIVNFLSKKKNFNILATYRKNFKTKKKNIKFIKLDLNKKFNFNFNPDFIILCAGRHKIEDFKKKSEFFFKNNISISRNLVDFAKKKKNSPNLIFFSTIDISYKNYPKKKKIYINSKVYSEKLFIRSSIKNIFNKVIILRLPAILGKNCNKNFLSDSKKKLKSNKNIKIYNSKSKYNNFIHVSNILKSIVSIISDIKKYKKKTIINLLSSNGLSTLETLRYMKKRLKSKSQLIVKDNLGKKIKLDQTKEAMKPNLFSAKINLDKFIKD